MTFKSLPVLTLQRCQCLLSNMWDATQPNRNGQMHPSCFQKLWVWIITSSWNAVGLLCFVYPYNLNSYLLFGQALCFKSVIIQSNLLRGYLILLSSLYKMKKLRHRVVKYFFKDYTTDTWWSWNLYLSDFKTCKLLYLIKANLFCMISY